MFKWMPMQLFDSHCHLDDAAYRRDVEAVFERARAAGVSGIMTIGVTLATSRKALDLAKARPGVYASVGVHPHDAQECSEQVLEELVRLSGSPQVRAWGETGLDFNRMHSPRDEQEKWFLRQLEAASERSLPMIFHERDSQGRFLELLKTCPPPSGAAVVHCFSGTRAELRRYLDMGYYIGITGILTLKERGESLRRQVLQIPSEQLLVETDAPYLVPEPQRRRFRRNEPAFVRSVLLKLAEVRGEDPEELARTVFANTCRFYRIADNGSDLLERLSEIGSVRAQPPESGPTTPYALGRARPLKNNGCGRIHIKSTCLAAHFPRGSGRGSFQAIRPFDR